MILQQNKRQEDGIKLRKAKRHTLHEINRFKSSNEFKDHFINDEKFSVEQLGNIFKYFCQNLKIASNSLLEQLQELVQILREQKDTNNKLKILETFRILIYRGTQEAVLIISQSGLLDFIFESIQNDDQPLVNLSLEVLINLTAFEEVCKQIQPLRYLQVIEDKISFENSGICINWIWCFSNIVTCVEDEECGNVINLMIGKILLFCKYLDQSVYQIIPWLLSNIGLATKRIKSINITQVIGLMLQAKLQNLHKESLFDITQACYNISTMHQQILFDSGILFSFVQKYFEQENQMKLQILKLLANLATGDHAICQQLIECNILSILHNEILQQNAEIQYTAIFVLSNMAGTDTNITLQIFNNSIMNDIFKTLCSHIGKNRIEAGFLLSNISITANSHITRLFQSNVFDCISQALYIEDDEGFIICILQFLQLAFDALRNQFQPSTLWTQIDAYLINTGIVDALKLIDTQTENTAVSSIIQNFLAEFIDNQERCSIELEIPKYFQLVQKQMQKKSYSKKPLLEDSKADMSKFRQIWVSGRTIPKSFPGNALVNTKYNILTIVPIVIYNQFKYFFNLFFLLITLSQFFPPLKVGFLFTYVAPLSFVLTITLLKEAYDDLVRMARDKEVNSQSYTQITPSGDRSINSSSIKVGHVIRINANERIPADMVLLQASDESGSVFIRTDQLDGETDWKLRKSVGFTQRLTSEEIINLQAKVMAETPQKAIYSFTGIFEVESQTQKLQEPLNLEQTLWASTVLASGTAIGLVIYTGKDTRSSMNSTAPKLKFGLTDEELNFLSKVMFGLMIVLSLVMLLISGLDENFYILFFRYLLLLSSIIPISLRVNLDMGKLWYCYLISTDRNIPHTVPRNSNIPEELGRIQYLLSDKTGTLTQNEMVLKKLRLISGGQYNQDEPDALSNLRSIVTKGTPIQGRTSGRIGAKDTKEIKELIMALALCNNVTPTREANGAKIFQASSPDEIALVQFAEVAGIELKDRKQDYIAIRNGQNEEIYTILEIFPFASATKRMGIILEDRNTKELIFYLKGAEDVMIPRVLSQNRHRIIEECDNLAREGLRTLVISKKTLDQDEYSQWSEEYKQASLSLTERDESMRKVIDKLEHHMIALGVTGVEDKLQRDVEVTIENILDAGIKIWVLTGDKVETAKCIAISTRLKQNEQQWFQITGISDSNQIQEKLTEFGHKNNPTNFVLVIDGQVLTSALKDHKQLLIQSASKASSVVCCRVSPTQKTEIVESLQKFTNKRICSIGDGGNDVGMIQAAHVGIGIEGKEGKQASLAADFSITQFKAIRMLILWHGRLSYKRTAKMSNFVFHRGLIISVIQALFTCLFYFSTIQIYNGFLMMGYATVYTNMPVFSIVLDQDSDVNSILWFPPLYKTLQRGRALNLTMFAVWIWKSIYQGSMIILLTIILFPENNFTNFVAITFTALIFTELLNVITEIEQFHWGMGITELITLIIYMMSMFGLSTYFDLYYIFSVEFIWKVISITLASWGPLHIASILKDRFDPTDAKRVSG